MDMIYIWYENHGVKWFYKNNDDLEDWIFTGKDGKSIQLCIGG